MSTKTKRRKIIAGAAIVLAALTAPASASQSAAYAQVSYDITSIPVGAAEFCHTRPGECGVNSDPVETFTLTEERWAQLLQINSHANTTITPVTDQELYNVGEYWTYPDSGYGDCEDIALAKRRDLISAGWAPSTLLMSVVRQSNGEGHAVLMVRTDRGDLILDNQDSRVLMWGDSPYHFLKRQSQYNSAEWVDIMDDRPIIVAAVQ
jgi:predicted transglutaminase-like cysteine proteinase